MRTVRIFHAREIFFIKGHEIAFVCERWTRKIRGQQKSEYGGDGPRSGRVLRAKSGHPRVVVRDKREKTLHETRIRTREKNHGKLMIHAILRYLREILWKNRFYDNTKSTLRAELPDLHPLKKRIGTP